MNEVQFLTDQGDCGYILDDIPIGVDRSDSEDYYDPSLASDAAYGGEYVNDTAGLGISFDENWIIADEDYIAQLNGMLVSECSDEDLAELLADSGAVTVLYKILVCYKNGNYIAACTAASYETDTTEEILSLFYTVN